MDISESTISSMPGATAEPLDVQRVSLAEILEQGRTLPPNRQRLRSPGEVVIGTLSNLGSGDVPLVLFDEAEAVGPLPALTIIEVSQTDVGRQVVLAFNQGNINQPIILGFLRHEENDSEVDHSSKAGVTSQQILVDGETLRIDAKQKIELRCGKASITLTADGNVLIRGAYVLTRASGTNRIRGGNVQIN